MFFSAGAGYPITLGINNTEKARIDSSGNLLVGTTSAVTKLTVSGKGSFSTGVAVGTVSGSNAAYESNYQQAAIVQYNFLPGYAAAIFGEVQTSTNSDHWFGITGNYGSYGSATMVLQACNQITNNTSGNYITSDASGILTFGQIIAGAGAYSTNASKTEFMRLDGSGNLSMTGGGKIYGQGSGGLLLKLGYGSTDAVTLDGGVTSFYPSVDNNRTLGYSSQRWTTVYATTGTINTSDATTKQWLGDFNETEMAVASDIFAEIGSYKFLDAMEEKGDKARIHVGVRAQNVEQAFTKQGLTGFDYGLLCFDKWEDDVTEGAKAGQRYGIRNDELHYFLIAALEKRLKASEATVADLTTRLAALEAK
jgi:hypothetical protein